MQSTALVILRTCLFLLVSSAGLAQATVYVDSQSGDDSSSGMSETNPVKTLGFALSSAPGSQEVRMLPGVASNQFGESFPISVPAGKTVAGLGGPQ